jgi:O-antigen/teichoic acid export membrane protein
MPIGSLLNRPVLRSITLAYTTTAISKLATAGVQIAALPIIASRIGETRFGALLALGALASLMTTAGLGMAPVASQGIAMRLGQKDTSGSNIYFWNQFILGAASGSALFLITLLLSWLGKPESLLGAGVEPFHDDVRVAFIALGAHVFLFYAFGFIDGARAAYNESHITNTFGIAASIIITSGCLTATRFQLDSMAFYYFLLFGVPVALQSINLLMFVSRHRTPLTLFRPSVAHLREISSRVISYMQTQFGLSLHIQAPVYLAGHFIGLDASALLGSVARLFSLVHNTLWSLANPVLPLMSRAFAAGHPDRARQIGLTTSGSLLGTAALLGLAFAVFGPRIMDFWLELGLDQPPLFFRLAGLFFFFFSGLHIAYLVLIAGNNVGFSQSFLMLSGVSAAIIATLSRQDIDLTALVAINCACMVFVAAPPMARQIRQLLHRTE